MKLHTRLVWATIVALLDPAAAIAQNWSTGELVRLDRCQLLAIYASAETGPIPQGFTPGRAMRHPGRPLTPARAALLSRTLWQGKIFLDDAHMVNRVLGKEKVPGAVYVAGSWYDGKPSIIIDYTGSWWYAAQYRDEFREVSPGTYLGLTYRQCPQPEVRAFFVLDARSSCR